MFLRGFCFSSYYGFLVTFYFLVKKYNSPALKCLQALLSVNIYISSDFLPFGKNLSSDFLPLNA